MIRRLIILLLIVGCNNKQEKLKNNNTSAYWEIKYFVDQNYEPTDVGYITNINPIIGTYSNSEINGNPLKVKIMIKERAVGIKLYENAGDVSFKAPKENPIDYNMTIKHNKNNIDFVFRGINENDIVVIGDIISSTHQTTLINYLKKGGEFNFYLETKNDPNNSTYEFEINDQSKPAFLNLLNKLNST